MLLTLLSGLFGFLGRLLPEMLRWRFELKRAGLENAHELAMMGAEIEVQKIKLRQKLDVLSAQGDMAQLPFVYDPATLKTGNKYTDFLNYLVRPLLTFTVVGMWVCKKWLDWTLVTGNPHILTSPYFIWQPIVWDDNDVALLFVVVTYYFTGRALDKLRKA